METTVEGIITSLAEGANGDTFQSFETLVAERTCSESQIDQMLTALIPHLLESKIPEGYTRNRTTGRALLAISSISTIAECYIHEVEPPPRKLTDKIVSLWPSVFKWLRFFVKNDVGDTTSSVMGRAGSKQIVIDVLSIYTGMMVLRPALYSFPEVIPLVMKIWMLEITEPGLHPANKIITDPPTLHAAIILNLCFSAVTGVSKQLVAAAIALEYDFKDVASFALTHLRQCLREEDIGQNHSIGMNVRLINYFAHHDSLHRALLSQRSVVAVTKAAVVLARESVIDRGSMRDCLKYLRRTFDTGNGFTWITQALKAQFLPIILQVLLCPAEEEDTASKELDSDATHVLSFTLPRYLIYDSVLVAACRAVKKVQASPIGNRFSGSEWLDLTWANYVSEVERFMWISGRDNNNAKRFDVGYTCNYSLCDRDAPKKFGRCGGCMTAYYCSRDHQRKDWENHRGYCKDVQFCDEGFSVALLDTNRGIILQAIRVLMDENRHHIPQFIKYQNHIVLTIAFDFTLFPIQLSIEIAGTTCPLEEDGPEMDNDKVAQSWTCLIEEHRARSPGKAIVCAKIPMGQSEKVIMDTIEFPEPS